MDFKPNSDFVRQNHVSSHKIRKQVSETNEEKIHKASQKQFFCNTKRRNLEKLKERTKPQARIIVMRSDTVKPIHADNFLIYTDKR